MFISYENFFYLAWYIQIIAESLPISSSGHIRLLYFLFNKLKINTYLISKKQEDLMHLPTLFIVPLFLIRFAAVGFYNGNLFNYPLSFFLNTNYIFNYLLAIFIANIITTVFYFLITEQIKNKFPIWLGFSITSIILFYLKYINTGTKLFINPSDALIIGFAQALSLLPGISRLAATIFAGYCCGLNPIFSFIFSLILEIPLILGAVSKAYLQEKNNFKNLIPSANFQQVILLLLASFISYLSLWILLYLINFNLIYYFAWYMLFIAIFFII